MTHTEYTARAIARRAGCPTSDTNTNALDLPSAFVLGFGLGVVAATLLAMAIIG